MTLTVSSPIAPFHVRSCWRVVAIYSNEYHLRRMSVVHRLSPVVSLLAPLGQLGASWGYEGVPYPQQCSDDEGKKFQARWVCVRSARFERIPRGQVDCAVVVPLRRGGAEDERLYKSLSEFILGRRQC